MRNLIILMSFIAICVAFNNCQAGEFRLLEVDKFHLEATKFVGVNRHWSARPQEPRAGTLNLVLDLSDYSKSIFFRQRVDSHYTTSQFRYIALTSEVAVEPWRQGIEIFINHKSEHALDYTYEIDYPNSNTVGVRIKFVD